MKVIQIKNKEIKLPIVQGGMGVGISLNNLASAVINEGGIGTISAAQIGYQYDGFFTSLKKSYELNIIAVGDEIKKVKKKSNGFLAINIMTASRQYKDLCIEAVNNNVDAIVSGAGLPLDLPKYVKDSKTAAIPIVSSVRVLDIIIKKWMKKYNYLPDAVIIEGPLAGGHLGVKKSEINQEVKSLEDHTIDVIDYLKQKKIDIPVIVAGGIYTSSDVKRFIDLGADMVQLGTRFIATHEADCHINLKQNLVNAKVDDMIIVPSPVGYPARAIKNNFSNEILNNTKPVDKCIGCVIPCKGRDISTPYCISRHLIDAVNGDLDNGLFFTGYNGYKVDKIVSVKELVSELLKEIR